MDKIINNILLLGNGWDLQLDLKSSFKDFILHNYFAGEEDKISKLYTASIKYGRIDLLTLSILLFFENGNWKNSELKNKLSENYFIFAFLWFKFNEWLKTKTNNFEIDDSWSDVETVLKYILKNKFPIFDDYERPKQIILPLDIKIYNNEHDRLEIIKKSLQKFENEFNNYLLKQCKKIDFESKSCDHLIKFIWKFSDIISRPKYWWVLNFNYTNIDYKSINEYFLMINSLYTNKPIMVDRPHNIHGHINYENNSEIIIGIDDTDENDIYSEFTKSYRKAILNSVHYVQQYKDKEYIIPKVETLFSLPPREGDKKYKIYFYGHSLSKNDYSYFQAIFDKYELYSSDTELHFVYPPDKNDKTIPNRKHCKYKNIYSLIHGYGETLDNKDKGNNLFSKLILERRLLIDIIDWDENAGILAENMINFNGK